MEVDKLEENKNDIFQRKMNDPSSRETESNKHQTAFYLKRFYH